MDLGNAVIRTMRAQESLEAKFDQLLEKLGGTTEERRLAESTDGGGDALGAILARLGGAPSGEIEGEAITIADKAVAQLLPRLDDIGTKLDLLLEAVSALQPASKKKAKADPASAGDAAGDAASGGE